MGEEFHRGGGLGASPEIMFLEKRHCCCCVPLPDGVMLVGLYGTTFHAGLLAIQLAYGHATIIPTIISRVGASTHYTLDQYYTLTARKQQSRSLPKITTRDLLDGEVVDVLFPTLVAAHTLGILVNLLLMYGVWKHIRWLVTPWLALQGILATILAGLSLYYLILFPRKNECAASASHWSTHNNRNELFNGHSSYCYILLWYCVVMLLSLLTLTYYIYVVMDFFSQMKFFIELEDLDFWDSTAEEAVSSDLLPAAVEMVKQVEGVSGAAASPENPQVRPDQVSVRPSWVRPDSQQSERKNVSFIDEPTIRK